ncbi:MAG: Ig-like domain-containing protein [Syntrophomonas sp.]
MVVNLILKAKALILGVIVAILMMPGQVMATNLETGSAIASSTATEQVVDTNVSWIDRPAPDRPVSINKGWHIVFSKEVDSASLDGGAIHVLDNDGVNVTDIKTELQADEKTVLVSPQKYYDPGRQYSLVIEPTIKSKSGRTLLSGVRMPFVIQSPDAGLGQSITREFLMQNDGENWGGGFADLEVNYNPESYELNFNNSSLIEGLEGAGRAVLISGMNRSDDLFMFIKRKLTVAEGLQPDTTYSVKIETDFYTKAPAGAFGTGGAPGEAVKVKVGAFTTEPLAIPEDEKQDPRYYRMNLDKGGQNDEGHNAVQVGNIAKVNSTDFDTYELKTLSNNDNPLMAATDSEGRMWIMIGTDSGYEGVTSLYYTRVKVELTPWVAN